MLINLFNKVRDYFAKNPEKQILLILLVLSLLKGIIFAGVFPAFQAPDEQQHAGFIEVIALQHRIPKPEEKLPPIVNGALERSHWWDYWHRYTLYGGPPELNISAAVHLPLYYLLSAILFLIFYRFGDVWIFVIRLFGACLATGVIFFAFQTVRLIFPKDRFLMILVPTLIIFQPQFGFITSSINSDSMVVFLSAALIYLLIRFQTGKQSVWSSFLIGLTLGAGLFAKTSFVIFVPFVFGFFVILSLLRRLSLVDTIKHLLVVGGIALAIGGWWYVRNYFVGSPLFSPTPIGAPINKSLPELAIDRGFIDKMFTMFWADFGWLTMPIDNIWYRIIWYFTLVAFGGYLILAVRYVLGKVKMTFDQILSLILLAGASLMAYLGVTQFEIASRGGAQGRYLFIVIVPLFILFAFGLRWFFPRKLEKVAVIATSFGALSFFVLSIVYYIMPFYYG